MNWERHYQSGKALHKTRPSAFLKEVVGLLPRAGRALDLAAGEGRNAIFLARQGLTVEAIDLSPTAITRCLRRASRKHLPVIGRVADLEQIRLRKNFYDVVLCFHFLQRSLFRPIRAALKRKGFVVYETYTLDQRRYAFGPKKRKHLLKPNELLEAFRGFRIWIYRETAKGKGRASLLAQKI